MNYFLEFNWTNVFYNIVSIVLGVIVLIFAITKIVKNKMVLFPVICIIHALLFIGFGIGGFFFPEGYDFIPILALLAFVITLIVFFLTLGKKEKIEK